MDESFDVLTFPRRQKRKSISKSIFYFVTYVSALKFLVKILLTILIPPLNLGQRKNKSELKSNTEKHSYFIYDYGGGFLRVIAAQSFIVKNKTFLADQALLLITSLVRIFKIRPANA